MVFFPKKEVRGVLFEDEEVGNLIPPRTWICAAEEAIFWCLIGTDFEMEKIESKTLEE